MQPLCLPETAKKAADEKDFDLKGFALKAAPEQFRSPRTVRVGLIQNKIVLPTTAPFIDQRNSIMDRVRELVNTAAECGANIVCLQEAFHMPFAFCTREKVWCEFAEHVEGGFCVQACQKLAAQHGMVIICPILERDLAHSETVWNTAVVIGHKGNIIGKHRKVGRKYGLL